MVSTKIVKQHIFSALRIRNVEKICILERFLKDHVTLKTGVMAAGHSSLQSQE